MTGRKKQQPLEHRMLQTAIFCLLAGGAVMVYSASSARTLLQGQGDGSAYLVKYLAYGGVGLVAMHVLGRHGLALARRFSALMLLGAFALLVAVLIPGIGVEVNGAQRWLGAGPLRFQPAEIMKLAIVLHVAAVLTARPKLARHLRLCVPPILAVVVAAVGLIWLQPDLGTSLVIIGTTGAMLAVAGVPLRQMAVVAGAGAALVLLYAMLEPYRRARLTTFLNPWADAGDAGFQAVQGQIALGSGGFFGLGPGQSVQKIFYLPEAHTDFILAVIGEELGVVGILGLLSLYAMIAYAGLRTARRARDPFAKLVAAGITALILCQALLNIYTVLGLAPLTGVPLPFISSGSTSLIVLLCGMGVLLNVASGEAAHLRAVPEPPRERRRRDARAGRGGRDGRPRGAGHRGRRRAAG